MRGYSCHHTTIAEVSPSEQTHARPLGTCVGERVSGSCRTQVVTSNPRTLTVARGVVIHIRRRHSDEPLATRCRLIDCIFEGRSTRQKGTTPTEARQPREGQAPVFGRLRSRSERGQATSTALAKSASSSLCMGRSRIVRVGPTQSAEDDSAQRGAVTSEARESAPRLGRWSGRRDSNPRPPPWQGGALPAEPLPPILAVATDHRCTG